MNPRRRSRVSSVGSLALVAILAVMSGCGSEQGRYPLSGKVTFNGQPVPAGFIHFVPDTAKGGAGPASGAAISNGAYATPKGQGTAGGPHKVMIVGQDGVPFDSPEGRIEAGRSLFPAYELEIDLPQTASQQDFDVPLSPTGVPPAE